MEIIVKNWQQYHYKNITFVLLSIIFSLVLFRNEQATNLLHQMDGFGLVGAFIAGVLFVSTFTVSIGAVILIELAQYVNPVLVVLMAGVGAVAGDLTIFHYIRSKGLIDEIRHFFHFFHTEKLRHLLKTKYFSWSMPVIGAIIIASPLPDELGITLMGISHMKTRQFVVMSYLLNIIGIFLVVFASIMIR